MWSLPIKLNSVQFGAVLNASGSLGGVRQVVSGSNIYDGDTLTLLSASVAPSASATPAYQLYGYDTGSFAAEYYIYIARPFTQRVDVITLTGSYSGSNTINVTIANKSKS